MLSPFFSSKIRNMRFNQSSSVQPISESRGGPLNVTYTGVVGVVVAGLYFPFLRSCLSLPKVVFSLRSVDTTRHQEVLQHYNQVTREGLARILGVPPTDVQWLQAKLPVTMGGLGLRAAEEHGPAAYASSYLSSLPLLRSLRQFPEDSPSVPLPPPCFSA